jgi:N-acetylglucosamine malate deacetylase 2
VVVVVVLGLFKKKLDETDTPVAIHSQFPISQQKNVIMCIFAHPDDEISVAGTLCQLKQNADNQIVGVYLTRGEAGGTNGLVSKEKLGEERTKELANLAKVVNYQSLEMLGFADSGLPKENLDTLTKAVERMIYKYKPNIVISFDDKVGLYGHPDHLLVGKLSKAICERNATVDSFPVQELYCPTLSKGMIEIVMSIAETFKKNYPQDPEKGLPLPSFAVKISEEADCKLMAIQAHQTQKPTFDDVFPMHDRIVPSIFFSIFDKEYFTLQWRKK